MIPAILVVSIFMENLSIVSGISIGSGTSSIDTELMTNGAAFYGRAADRIVDRLFSRSRQLVTEDCKISRPSDCGELDRIICPTGIYTIYPDDTNGFDVLCEMEKDGGGWTVFQRRQNGLVNFYRNWAAYKQGFGSLNGEFWLGNEHLHQITSQASYALRIDMMDFTNDKKYAKYSKFSVGPESNGFALEVSGYSGNAGDSMKSHQNGQLFSTKDKDNDKSDSDCAELYKGGWWYKNCHHSNLNGLYLKGNHSSFANGVNWYHWRGYNHSMKTTTMMIKRLN